MTSQRASIAAVFTVALLAGFATAQERLVYVKKESREATRAASLAASGSETWTAFWHLIGPFDNADFSTSYPPENEIKLDATYPGKDETAVWRQFEFSDGKVHDLKKFASADDCCCYLYRRIESAVATRARVSLGSDDQIAVWLNGRKVFSNPAVRPAGPDQDFVILDLKPGANDLLLKIGNLGGGWEFYFARTPSSRLGVELERRLDDDFPPTGEAAHYRIRTIPLPEDEVIEGGGLAFRPDGKLYVATRRGDIWLVDNPLSDDPDGISIRPYARGLHEVLGLTLVGDNDLYLVQRPEITLVRDTDGDDVADDFTTINDRFGCSGDYHEFIFGPARDADGNLFVTLNVGFGGGHQSKVPYRGWCIKVTPKGEMIPWAYGLRSPNGVKFSPDGRLYFTDNQGEWVASCKMHEIRQGEFYGHMASVRWHPDMKDGDQPKMTPPCIWFPYSQSQSATEPVWDATAGKFGPFAGQCFVGELTSSAILRVSLEEVAGRMQGACYPFRRGFESGVNRLEFASDGSLMAAQTNRGWGSVGGHIHGLQRIVYTGRVPFEIQEMKVTPTGWDVVFTQPVNKEAAANREHFAIDSYTYHHWGNYGSDEIERQRNEITNVSVSEDGRTVRLDVPQRKTGRVYHLNVRNVTGPSGDSLLHSDAWYTLNNLPQ